MSIEDDNDNPSHFSMLPRCMTLDHRLSDGAFRLYAYFRARAINRAGETWISQRIIGIDLNKCERHIRRNIKELEKLGLISVKRNSFGNNVYSIKNIREVYGDEIRKPWKKHEEYDDHRTYKSGTPDTGVLCDRTQESYDHRTYKSGKVEEVELEELNQKNKDPQRLTPSTQDDLSGLSYEDAKIGKSWLEFALSEMKWKKPPVGWSQINFAKAVYKIRKSTGLNDSGLTALLDFIKGDDFWNKNALSPSALFTKSKNGNRKLDNILLAMKSSNKAASVYDKIKDLDLDKPMIEGW